MRFAWHVHHSGRLLEELEGWRPIRNRRSYIQHYKPKEERKLRLRLLKVVKGSLPKIFLKRVKDFGDGKMSSYPKPTLGVLDLHRKECKNCPWNGHTIFPVQIPARIISSWGRPLL